MKLVKGRVEILYEIIAEYHLMYPYIVIFFLLFLTEQPVLFAIVYGWCGISDIADGFIARLFHVETELGAKLDSVADFLFWGVLIYLLLTHIRFTSLIIVVLLLLLVVRGMTVIVTKVKFSKWSIMHTIGNKIVGLLLFFTLPICFFVGYFPTILVLSVGIIAFVSAMKESFIRRSLYSVVSSHGNVSK